MSKTSNDPVTTTISINGKPKVTTTKYGDGTSYSNYSMSEWEQQAYDYAQEEFAKNLGNVNIFSDDVLQSLKDEVSAYTNKGIKKINDMYAPMIRNLENDIASRFGNLDNSIFLDKLSGIENKRSDSVTALAEDISAKESAITSNELMKRYNYLNFLNDYQNQVLDTALGSTSKNAANTKNTSSSGGYGYDNLTNQLQDITMQTIATLLTL